MEKCNQCDLLGIGIYLWATALSIWMLLYLHLVWVLPDVQKDIVAVMVEAPAIIAFTVSFYNLLKSISKYISCRRGYGVGSND